MDHRERRSAGDPERGSFMRLVEIDSSDAFPLEGDSLAKLSVEDSARQFSRKHFWRKGFSLTSVLAVCVILLVVVFTSGSAPRPPSTRQVPLARTQARKHLSGFFAAPLREASVNDLAKVCEKPEEGKDYETDTALYEMEGIESAELCHQKCVDASRCGAWTWGKVKPQVWGLSKVCFLKELGLDQAPRKHDNPKVVSGLACRPGEHLKASSAELPKKNAAKAPSEAMKNRFDLSKSHPQHQVAVHEAKKKKKKPDPDDPDPDACNTMLCFSLMIPGSYEVELLGWQYQYEANIFACDEFAVYSNATVQVTPGLTTHLVNISLDAPFGGEFGTALNTDIFMAVWKKVISDGRFALYCWTVKADPDTVFFAARLQGELLKFKEDEDHGVYLNNCKMGMHGPLEVFSRRAVQVWYKGAKSCFEHFYKLCSGPCLWGEDMFVDQCLGRFLKVKRENVYNLLVEDHCAPPDHWRDCKDTQFVAFHPFKMLPEYMTCLNNADPKRYPKQSMSTATTTQELSTTTIFVAPAPIPAPPAPSATNEPASSGTADDLVSATDDLCDMKVGVDYETDKPLYAMEGVLSAEMCAEKCRDESRCGVWTWGQAPDQWGLTNVCFLKYMGLGQMPVQRINRDVVSGLSCREEGDGTIAYHQQEDTSNKAMASALQAGAANSAVTIVQQGQTSKPTLFCFALMRPTGYEASLIAWQYAFGTSIFGCDEATVYSNITMKVTEGLVTGAVDVDLTCQYGGEFGTALNFDIFRAVWNQVVADGRFALYGWTVKVDPDTVFIPSRLVAVLEHYKETDKGVYLNNCKMGMHGPLEVFSQQAVQTWYHGVDACYLHFYKICSGPCLWGEDMFIDQCLGKKLKVTRQSYYHLLTEEHCSPPKGWRDCKDGASVSFHPFKNVSSFKRCLMAAEPHLFASTMQRRLL